MDDLKEAIQETMEDVKEKLEENVGEIKEKVGEMCVTTKKDSPSLGIIRLDYDYPPALGDVDCHKSFSYDVYYKVVPGLTFEMCQSGTMTDEVQKSFKDAIQWLVENKKVSGIVPQ